MQKVLTSLLLFSFILFYVQPHVLADPSEKVILQQYLTIVEVERDLNRVQEDQQTLQKDIAVNESHLSDQEKVVAELRKKGAKIIREYYTGERISLISMVLSMESFQHGMLMIEYIYEIFNRDMTELQASYEAFQKLVALQQELRDKQLDLTMLKSHYSAQKNRLEKLQNQLNTSLENVPEKERLQQLMKQLEEDWLQKGEPAFTMFFNQLAEAMQQFPEIIKKDNLSLKGTSPKITITDQEINDFLVQKNPIFKELSFSFRDNEMWAQGVHEGVALTLIGSYELVSDQKLAFTIHQMTYDGFNLPPSTIEEMEKSIDLGFYPAYIHPNIRVKSFSMRDHSLHLELKFSLKK